MLDGCMGWLQGGKFYYDIFTTPTAVYDTFTTLFCYLLHCFALICKQEKPRYNAFIKPYRGFCFGGVGEI